MEHRKYSSSYIFDAYQYDVEAGWLCLYSDLLRAGGYGDRIPVGARFSATVQTGSEVHPASSTRGTGSYAGGKAAGELR